MSSLRYSELYYIITYQLFEYPPANDTGVMIYNYYKYP